MGEETKKQEAGQLQEKVKELWGKMQETVSPVVGWAIFGGTLALAILLGLLICL